MWRTRSDKPANKAQKTQQKILDAAERHFAEKGFDGASMREITADAGVNLSVAYYYFESKEKLLLRVFERNLLPLLNWQEKELAAAREEFHGEPIPLRRLIEISIYSHLKWDGRESEKRFRAMIFSRRDAVEGTVCRTLFAATEKLRLTMFEEYARVLAPRVSSSELHFRLACLHAVVNGLQLFGQLWEKGMLAAKPLSSETILQMLISALESMLTAPATLPLEESVVPAKES